MGFDMRVHEGKYENVGRAAGASAISISNDSEPAIGAQHYRCEPDAPRHFVLKVCCALLLAMVAPFILGSSPAFAEVVRAEADRAPTNAASEQLEDAQPETVLETTAQDRADKVPGEGAEPVYVWSAVRSDGRVTLRGATPSEEDRQTVLGMVKAHFPDLDVDERVKIVSEGLQREQWLGAVSFSLQQLSHLRKGRVRLANAKLLVAGVAISAEEYAEVKKALAGPLPDGLTLKSEAIRPPVADPFVFTADLGINALSLAGSVPSEGARKDLRELSRQLFERPGLDDRLKIASGAPKNWDEAVAAALRALSRLETGKVALSGSALSIEGLAPDQGTAVAVSHQLRRDLPKMFSTSESIKWKEVRAPLGIEPKDPTRTDTAVNVIPRIKSYTRTKTRWDGPGLPPLTTYTGER